VIRGGSWESPNRAIRAASRSASRPSVQWSNFGFRLARTRWNLEEASDGDADTDSDWDADFDTDSDIDIDTESDVSDSDMDVDVDVDTVSDADGDLDIDDDSVCGDLICSDRENFCACPSDCGRCGESDCESVDWSTICVGTFLMGAEAPEMFSHATLHEVTLTRNFEILTTEVTQEFFEETLGYNTSVHLDCPSCPMEQVNWHEAAAFCNALSADSGLPSCYSCSGLGISVICEPGEHYPTPFDCPGYRLPTESEWEYAARAGTLTPRYGEIDDIAWWIETAWAETHEVGTLLPNDWSLYDMLGNVWEWCHDWFGEYPTEPATDPWGLERGGERSKRGGCFSSDSWAVSADYRGRDVPRSRISKAGFRPCRTLL